MCEYSERIVPGPLTSTPPLARREGSIQRLHRNPLLKELQYLEQEPAKGKQDHAQLHRPLHVVDQALRHQLAKLPPLHPAPHPRPIPPLQHRNHRLRQAPTVVDPSVHSEISGLVIGYELPMFDQRPLSRPAQAPAVSPIVIALVSYQGLKVLQVPRGQPRLDLRVMPPGDGEVEIKDCLSVSRVIFKARIFSLARWV